MKILQILDNHGIFYRTEGKNCAKNHCVIRCPMCGNADPSEHMGIHLEKGYWACWRNARHRGRDLADLLVVLLRCSRKAAQDLLQQPTLGSGFAAQLNSIMGRKQEKEQDDYEEVAEWPGKFRRLNDGGVFGKRAFNYLVDKRGFSPDHAEQVIKRYDLRYAVTGKWAGRILFPVLGNAEGYNGWQPQTWTARAISDKLQPPYKAFKGVCNGQRENIKHKLYLYNRAYSQRPGLMFIVEGPFDALKVNFFGRGMDASAVAIFGLTMSVQQVAHLAPIIQGWRVLACLDPTALAQNLQLASQLSHLGVKRAKWPFDVTRDPGDLAEHEVKQLVAGNR